MLNGLDELGLGLSRPGGTMEGEADVPPGHVSMSEGQICWGVGWPEGDPGPAVERSGRRAELPAEEQADSTRAAKIGNAR